MSTFTTTRWEIEDNALALVSELAQRISLGTPLSEILDCAVKLITTVTGCAACVISSLDGHNLLPRASSNSNAEALRSLNARVGQAATGWAADQNTPIFMPRATVDGDCEDLLTVPMVVAGRAVGVIHVFDCREHWCGKRKVELLSTLGFLLGAELERIRLEKDCAENERKLSNRTVFERAKKILQNQLHISEEDAYLTLQRESKRRNTPMHDLAEAIALSEDLRLTGQPGRGKRS